MGLSCLRIPRSDHLYPERCSRLMGESAPPVVELLGNLALLRGPHLGLLVSRRCPGTIVLETFDAVRRFRRGPWSVIGGFNSPMERQCLESLLIGRIGVVMVLPRPCTGMRVRREWREPLEQGRLAFLSPFPDGHRRSDRGHAHERNCIVAALSDSLFVPFAAELGSVEGCVVMALGWGTPLLTVGANTQPLLLDRADLVERWSAGHLPGQRTARFALT